MKSYTLDVKWDGDEAFILFPEDEMIRLGWKEGDTLEWIDNKDGSWTLQKQNNDFVGKVLKFNHIAGKKGNEFSVRDTSLYVGLILEEVAELIESIDGNELGKLHTALEYHSKRFKQGDFDRYVEKINRVDALDACVDIAVVAVGGASALGADVDGACHEVADSNLSKYELKDGEYVVLRDANGKIMKPASYRPPELKKFLR